MVFWLLFFPLLAFPESRAYKPDEVIIRLKKGFSEELAKLQDKEAKDAVSGLAKDLGINVEEVVILSKKKGIYLIRTRGHSVEELIQRLGGNPLIDSVEPNYMREVKALPNDFSFYDLWGLEKIRAKEAWDLNFGVKEIIVALVDTGIDWTHEDLAQNLWRNPGEIPDDGIDNDLNGFADDIHGLNAWSIVQGGGAVSDIMDFHGHGTHIAGIIGAAGNNGKGVVGVNWKVKILGCKAGYAEFDNAALLKCADYITDLKDRGIDIRIVNFSAGGSLYSELERDLIVELGQKGILVIVPAGNDGKNLDYFPLYPCSYGLDNLICVASTDRNDNLSYFSNYGSKVHVAAPGEGIWSTWPYITSDEAIVHGRPAPLPDSIPVYSFNFDTGPQGFSFSETAGLSSRESYSYPYSVTDSVDSNYPNGRDIRIISPILDLSSYRAYKTFLRAMAKPYVAYGEKVRIEGSKNGGKDWVPLLILERPDLLPYYGKWTGFALGIPRDLRTPGFRFQFRLMTDAIWSDDGIYWDDVSIDVVTYETSRYNILQGTSMAVPFVTGLASLIWSREPWLSHKDVKERILQSVDFLPQLAGKVVTSGRINAEKAVKNGTFLFLDVPPDHWAYTYIGVLKHKGVTRGYEDGTYRPSNPASRDEIAALLVRSLYGEIFNFSDVPYFTDVNPSMWAFRYIQKLYEEGLTLGCGGSRFCPKEATSRAEIVAFIVRALLGEDFAFSHVPYFWDAQDDHWAFKYIQKGRELGIVQGYGDGSFRPDTFVTRAEVAALLWRAFFRNI